MEGVDSPLASVSISSFTSSTSRFFDSDAEEPPLVQLEQDSDPTRDLGELSSFSSCAPSTTSEYHDLWDFIRSDDEDEEVGEGALCEQEEKARQAKVLAQMEAYDKLVKAKSVEAMKKDILAKDEEVVREEEKALFSGEVVGEEEKALFCEQAKKKADKEEAYVKSYRAMIKDILAKVNLPPLARASNMNPTLLIERLHINAATNGKVIIKSDELKASWELMIPRLVLRKLIMKTIKKCRRNIKPEAFEKAVLAACAKVAKEVRDAKENEAEEATGTKKIKYPHHRIILHDKDYPVPSDDEDEPVPSAWVNRRILTVPLERLTIIPDLNGLYIIKPEGDEDPIIQTLLDSAIRRPDAWGCDYVEPASPESDSDATQSNSFIELCTLEDEVANAERERHRDASKAERERQRDAWTKIGDPGLLISEPRDNLSQDEREDAPVTYPASPGVRISSGSVAKK